MNSVVDEIREEGRLESSIQAAKRMLKLGKLTYEDIATCTDLPLSEIIKLAQEKNTK